MDKKRFYNPYQYYTSSENGELLHPLDNLLSYRLNSPTLFQESSEEAEITYQMDSDLHPMRIDIDGCAKLLRDMKTTILEPNLIDKKKISVLNRMKGIDIHIAYQIAGNALGELIILLDNFHIGLGDRDIQRANFSLMQYLELYRGIELLIDIDSRGFKDFVRLRPRNKLRDKIKFMNLVLLHEFCHIPVKVKFFNDLYQVVNMIQRHEDLGGMSASDANLLVESVFTRFQQIVIPLETDVEARAMNIFIKMLEGEQQFIITPVEES